MKTNYQLWLDELINNLDYKPTLLLHSCCGPCSSYVLTYLKDYFDITVLYYNPNIEPKSEYQKRKDYQLKLLDNLKIKYLDCSYDNEVFEKLVINNKNDVEGGQRCHICYEMRLDKTGLLAFANNFEYFGTTLTVSPYKNSKILNEIGDKIQNKYNIKYLFSDFKKKDGYKKSIELSHKYDLYRQNYCGCIYSKGTLYEKNS